MAQPARTLEPHPNSPEDSPVDPTAVERAYRKHRAMRTARSKRRREKRRANIRFWALVLIAVAVAVLLAARTLGEIQRVFGL